jgi:hypothetical protein
MLQGDIGEAFLLIAPRKLEAAREFEAGGEI